MKTGQASLGNSSPKLDLSEVTNKDINTVKAYLNYKPVRKFNDNTSNQVLLQNCTNKLNLQYNLMAHK